MKYFEYFNAAVKHLNACQLIIEKYDHWDEDDYENDLLLELYYLCGYAIEGLVNYAIFKLYDFSESEDVETLDEKVDQGKVISFGESQYPNGTEYYVLCHHQFQKNRKLLQCKVQVHGIPYLDSHERIDATSTTLIKDWKSSVRYTSYDNYKVNYQEVKALYEICSNMCDKLVDKIG